MYPILNFSTIFRSNLTRTNLFYYTSLYTFTFYFIEQKYISVDFYNTHSDPYILPILKRETTDFDPGLFLFTF